MKAFPVDTVGIHACEILVDTHTALMGCSFDLIKRKISLDHPKRSDLKLLTIHMKCRLGLVTLWLPFPEVLQITVLRVKRCLLRQMIANPAAKLRMRQTQILTG